MNGYKYDIDYQPGDELLEMLDSIRNTRTLETMSTETGVKIPTLSRILNRNREPGFRIMVKLLKAYPLLAECLWSDRKVVRISGRN